MHTVGPTSGNGPAQGAWLGGRTSYALQPARVRLNAVHWGASSVAAAYMRSRFPSRHTPMKPVPKVPISGCHSLAPLLVADPVSAMSTARSRSASDVGGFTFCSWPQSLHVTVVSRGAVGISFKTFMPCLSIKPEIFARITERGRPERPFLPPLFPGLPVSQSQRPSRVMGCICRAGRARTGRL